MTGQVLGSVRWDRINPWATFEDPAERVRTCSLCGDDYDDSSPCACDRRTR